MNHKLVPLFWMVAGGSFGRAYLGHRKELARRETLSRDAMLDLQWRALRRLLEHAYEHVPFYRKRFDDAGLHPDRIRTPEEFRSVPRLTREDLHENREELVATNFDRTRLQRNQTGGSTGNPVAFYDYEANKALQKAVTARSRSWAGFEEGQKIAIVWGAARDLPAWGRLERLKIHRILNQRWLNSYHLTPETMAEFAEQMIRWQPRYILGYATGLYVFARFLREQKLERIRPVAVETSAEKLWNHQRELIEDVFRCKVFDAYGARDVSNIAFECEEHSGLHVLDDNVYLEVLANGKPVRPGETGEVIVTKLTNFAMPLIRYRNGDLATVSEQVCPCGRPFPLLSEVVGRSNDVIATPSGELVHAAYFSRVLYDVEGIRQFQVRQPALDRVEIALRSDRVLAEDTLDGLRATIARQLGPEVEVTVRCVDAIEPTPTGKHRYVISDFGRQLVERSGSFSDP